MTRLRLFAVVLAATVFCSACGVGRAETAPTPAETTQVAELPAELVVAGEVVVLEPGGEERRDVNGRMDLALWLGNSGGHYTVDIVDGRWRAQLVQQADGTYATSAGAYSGRFSAEIRNARIAASSPELTGGGGAVVLVDDAQRFAFGDEDVVVHVRRVTSIRVFVEDAQTGAPLDQVTILKIDDWRRDSDQHPGDLTGAVLVEDAVSPIDLEPRRGDANRGNGNCLVWSPGYAWTAVQIDFSGGGERRVRLERGGDLEVYLQGAPNQAGAVLRLRSREAFQGPPEPGHSPSPAPFTSHELSSEEPILFEGLPVGEYRLGVEVGDWWDSPLVLGRGTANVVAGGVEQVTLTMEDAPEFIEASLSGLMILPAEWELDRYWVSFELMDTPLDGSDGRHTLRQNSFEKLAGTEDTYAFDLGRVQTGKYEMTLGALQYGIVFELGPEGRSDVTLEVPPPVEITILLRDETTGEAADIDRIHWNSKRPPGVTGGGLEQVQRESGADRFRVRVPRSEISITSHAGQYTRAHKTFWAEDGLEVVLAVRPAIAAIVWLEDGGTRIPWPNNDYGRAEHLEGDGHMGTRGRRQQGLWFTVSEPGRYRVTIPEVPGYEPHEPVEVDLVEGETKQVVVQLVRLP